MMCVVMMARVVDKGRNFQVPTHIEPTNIDQNDEPQR